MLATFIVFFTVNAFAAGTIHDQFYQLISKPTDISLKTFRAACNEDNKYISFEKARVLPEHLKAKKSLDRNLVSGLMHAYLHCSDGEQKEVLLDLFGNHIALYSPAALIEEIHALPKPESPAPFMETIDESRFPIYCKDEACRARRAAFFQQKRDAISRASIPKEMEKTRAYLLAILEKFAKR